MTLAEALGLMGSWQWGDVLTVQLGKRQQRATSMRVIRPLYQLPAVSPQYQHRVLLGTLRGTPSVDLTAAHLMHGWLRVLPTDTTKEDT